MTAPTLPQHPARLLWALLLAGRGQPSAPVITAGPSPDAGWLARVRSGDLTAQREYVGRYWSTALREARRYARLGGPEDDLAGEAAVALWEAAFTYDPGHHRTSLDRYVAGRIHQRVRRAYRAAMGYDKQAEVIPLPDLEAERLADPNDPYAPVEWEADLDRATRDLAPEDRAAIESAWDRSLPSSRPVPARTRKRLERARRRLRDRLAGSRPDGRG